MAQIRKERTQNQQKTNRFPDFWTLLLVGFWVPAAIRTCRLPISDDSGKFLSWICKRIPRICRNKKTWETYQKPTKTYQNTHFNLNSLLFPTLSSSDWLTQAKTLGFIQINNNNRKTNQKQGVLLVFQQILVGFPIDFVGFDKILRFWVGFPIDFGQISNRFCGILIRFWDFGWISNRFLGGQISGQISRFPLDFWGQISRFPDSQQISGVRGRGSGPLDPDFIRISRFLTTPGQ